MEETGRIKLLFQKYLDKTYSATELEELDNYLRNTPEERLDPALNELWEKIKDQNVQYPVDWDRMYLNVLESDKSSLLKTVTPVRPLWKRWTAAASVIAVIALAAYFVGTRTQMNDYNGDGMAVQTDIQPGREGAILRLADGKVLLLDTVNSGTGLIANQGNSAIIVKGGTLVYSALSPTETPLNNSELYNTMTTPHGRQFSLELPDGTKVWLNAGSSIRFPVVFSPAQRKVEITGEAYFEVAARKSQPFIVHTKSQTIEVLGTSFNVNSYEDEDAEKTTLLNGAVRVAANGSGTGSSVILKPGEQAKISFQKSLAPATKRMLSVENVQDLNKVVAWKNGLFDFTNATLEEVMRQLARWYDIRVQFEGEVPDIEFAGRVGRDVSLSRMLVFFKESGVNFRMEGNTLIIGKK